MKIPKELKTLFKEKMAGNSFTTEQVKEILDPYFKFDEKMARKRLLSIYVNSFLASFKSPDGTRQCLSYKTSDGKKLYNFIDKTINVEILRLMNEGLQKHLNGLTNSSRKVSKRIEQIEGQMTVDNYFEILKSKNDLELQQAISI